MCKHFEKRQSEQAQTFSYYRKRRTNHFHKKTHQAFSAHSSLPFPTLAGKFIVFPMAKSQNFLLSQYRDGIWNGIRTELERNYSGIRKTTQKEHKQRKYISRVHYNMFWYICKIHCTTTVRFFIITPNDSQIQLLL